MKPFDLEKAKAGAPVCTREGFRARIVCFDADHNRFPIIALIKDSNSSNEYPVSLTKKEDFLMEKPIVEKIYSWWERRKRDG